MIESGIGNLLSADAEALVNTVNTQGIMGKGIALQFKKAFPEVFTIYSAACKQGLVQTGKVQLIDRNSIMNPRYVINFPTKEDWRKPSRIEYIEAGLTDLIRVIRECNIRSIAVPPLGCGNGGLYWPEVKQRIEAAFSALPDVKVLLFPPAGAPKPENAINKTSRPQMTESRAIVLKLLHQYCILGYELTLIEVQKLLYFLQEYGEPLNLRFEKKYYGPYADNLRHVLILFEGHFTRGFTDGSNKPTTPISLIPEALAEADCLLAEQSGNNLHTRRFRRVEKLIEGFESPYGMELLASVHWLVHHEQADINSEKEIVNSVHAWNPRKSKLMKPGHINAARLRLLEAENAGAAE